jgi:hypothetical protein
LSGAALFAASVSNAKLAPAYGQRRGFMLARTGPSVLCGHVC